MSVPENSRTKSKLEVCVKAHDLCCYTLQITANKKIFTEEYQRSLTDRIVETAIGIHCDCWNANNIYVRDNDDYRERKRLQEEAARKCNILLSLIDIAKPLFHLMLHGVTTQAKAIALTAFAEWMHITNRFGDNTLTVETELQSSEITITNRG